MTKPPFDYSLSSILPIVLLSLSGMGVYSKLDYAVPKDVAASTDYAMVSWVEGFNSLTKPATELIGKV
jgi:hypothetical protein